MKKLVRRAVLRDWEASLSNCAWGEYDCVLGPVSFLSGSSIRKKSILHLLPRVCWEPRREAAQEDFLLPRWSHPSPLSSASCFASSLFPTPVCGDSGLISPSSKHPARPRRRTAQRRVERFWRPRSLYGCPISASVLGSPSSSRF